MIAVGRREQRLGAATYWRIARQLLSMTGNHHHTPEEERRIREAALDQTIEASFPASDPPSSDPNPDNADAVPDARSTNQAQPHDSSAKTRRQGDA